MYGLPFSYTTRFILPCAQYIYSHGLVGAAVYAAVTSWLTRRRTSSPTNTKEDGSVRWLSKLSATEERQARRCMELNTETTSHRPQQNHSVTTTTTLKTLLSLKRLRREERELKKWMTRSRVETKGTVPTVETDGPTG
jgi:hypothetical protein